MIKEFLEKKYGKYVTNILLDSNNQVWLEEKDNTEEAQFEVMAHLKSLTNANGVRLIPSNFFDNNVEWGLDFSGWIGEFKAEEKEYFFIGAEPHINKNFQLVYNFGSYSDSLEETANHYLSHKKNIWYDLINIFVDDCSNITDVISFLKKCYIADLCHFVPKKCGQINSICETLSIKTSEWAALRYEIAKEFLHNEISIVKPKYIILHGKSARDFFKSSLESEEFIDESKLKIMEGEININGQDYKIISIPHLKGQMTNQLWRSKKNYKHPIAAKKIIRKKIEKDNLVDN
jgi:hypothetical protein